MRKTLSNVLVLSGLLGFILSGCSSSERSERILLKPVSKALYKIDVQGKLSSLQVFCQPAGSPNVYILDRDRSQVYVLNTGNGKLQRCGSLPLTYDWSGLTGFSVDEQAERLRLFFMDSAVTFDFNGRKKGVFLFENFVKSGFIYPADGEFVPLVKNGKVYASFFPEVEGNIRNPEYFSSPVEAEVDMKSKKVKFLEQSYPFNHQQNCYGFSAKAKRFEISPDVHAYWFQQHDSLYLRNIRTNELTVHFFGSRMPKQFRFIPYEKAGSVNEGAYSDVSSHNPFYTMPYNLPLSGFFGRNFVSRPKNRPDAYEQFIVLFDREFNYIGEMPYVDAWIIDSEKGVLTMKIKNQQLIIDQLSW